MDFIQLLATVLKISLFFTIVLTFVAYAVYAERRFSAIIQDRVGPNRTGIPLSILGFKKDFALPLGGLTQPLADGLKFIFKEDLTPNHVFKNFFWLAPCLTMVPALITIAVIPFASPFEVNGTTISMAISDLDLGPLFIFAIASLSVYGITIAGWSSNSKYSFFGGVRSSAQMISYEIALGLSIVPVLLYFGDLNLGRITELQARDGWLLLPLWNEAGTIFSKGYWAHPDLLDTWLLFIPICISFVIFTTSIFAETNRMPFDLPECETELVGGYHTEYSSMKFALFFLGEYAAMIIGSSLIITLFFGGWSIGFGIDAWLKETLPIASTFIHLGVFLFKIVAFVLFFILVRWTIPRFRYDQLMNLGWIVFFEAALFNVFLAALLIARKTIGSTPFFIGLSLLFITIILFFSIAKSTLHQRPSRIINPAHPS